LKLLFEIPKGLAFFNYGCTRAMFTTLQGKDDVHKTPLIYYQLADIKSSAG